LFFFHVNLLFYIFLQTSVVLTFQLLLTWIIDFDFISLSNCIIKTKRKQPVKIF
jgi:hypothetical protein